MDFLNNANKYTPNELKYIIHQYIQYARKKMESSPKFKILNIIRHIKNIEIRKNYVKLRTGFNTLNSSLGRFETKMLYTKIVVYKII